MAVVQNELSNIQYGRTINIYLDTFIAGSIL